MNLSEKLLDIQQNLPDFKKNATNPHFKNTYITLDGVLEGLLPMLNERGILLVQEPTFSDGQPTLTTTLINVEDPNDNRWSEQPLLLDKDTPQGHGSAITYGRRYALCCIFNIVADEDDDGEGGSSRGSRGTSGKSGPSTTSDGSGTTSRKF